MPSLQLRAVNAVLRLTRKPQGATAAAMRRRMAALRVEAGPPAALRARHDVRCRDLAGFPCWTVRPREVRAGAVYAHGGAYVSPTSPQHWDLVGRLADAGVAVEVPLYGLAPEHVHRAAHPVLRAAWDGLAVELGAARVAVAGDSAGGALALVLAQALLAEGAAVPGRLVLVAPWLDAALEGEGVAEVEQHDPWLGVEGLREAARAWSGGDPLEDPRLSPLHGPVAGLPPTTVYCGTRDLLLPDVQRFVAAARAAGVDVDLQLAPGAPHVHPLLPAPEGRAARDHLVRLVSGLAGG